MHGSAGWLIAAILCSVCDVGTRLYGPRMDAVDLFDLTPRAFRRLVVLLMLALMALIDPVRDAVIGYLMQWGEARAEQVSDVLREHLTTEAPAPPP